MTTEENYSDQHNNGGGYQQQLDTSSSYAGKFSNSPGSKGKPSKTKTAGRTPVNGELTLMASFYWKPPIDGKQEIEFLLNKKWSPSTFDFMEIAGPTKESPGSLYAFLGMIHEFAVKSIKRLNFFTHADKTRIGIDGSIDSTGVYFGDEVIDERIIQNQLLNNFEYAYKGNKFMLADVREKFSDDAIFVVYGCNAAYDPTTLLTGLRDLLHVTVIGFKDYIVFCPPKQDPASSVFNRKGEKIGLNKKDFKCGVDSTTDWRSLANSPGAVRVAK